MFTRAQINFDAMTKGKFAKHIERGWREICVDFEDMTSRAVEKNRFKPAALRNINHTVGTFWEGLVVHVRVIPNPMLTLTWRGGVTSNSKVLLVTLGRSAPEDFQPAGAVDFGGERDPTHR